MLADNDKVYSSNEVCEILGYSIRYLYTLIKKGKIKSVKAGTTHRFKGEWINDFIEESNK